MSDETTTTATPEPAAPAPAEPQAPIQPETQGNPRESIKRQAKAGVREAGRQLYENLQKSADSEAGGEGAERDARVDRHGRRHSPDDGKYLPENESEEAQAAEDEVLEEPEPTSDEDPAASSEAAATDESLAEAGEATTQDEGEDEASSEAAQDRVRVELGDHAITESGIDAITVSSEKEADALRALVNGTYHRVREVNELKQKLTKVHNELDAARREQIGREAAAAVSERLRQSPEYQEKVRRFKEIKRTLGDADASDYWQGQQESLRRMIEEEKESRLEQYETQQAEETAEEWRQGTRSFLSSSLPDKVTTLPAFNQWMDEELAAFETAVERGLYNEALARTHNQAQAEALLRQQFNKRFAMRLRNEPAVVQAYREATGKTQTESREPGISKEELEKRIEAEKRKAIEDFKRDVAKKRKDVPPHPIGGAGGEQPSQVSREDEQPDLSEMSPQQLKRYHRDKARGDARRRFAS